MERATALITGSAKRVGAAIARALAAEGYRIILHCNTSCGEGKALAGEIGNGCRTVQADLAAEDGVRMLLDGVPFSEGYGLLVNNASVFEKRSTKETARADLLRLFSVNLFAPVLLTRGFAEKFSKGHVVNILDTTAEHDNPDFTPYILTRRALASFTRLAAVEYAPRFRVNAIAPGVILKPESLPEGMSLPGTGNLPLQRHPDQEDLIRTVRYLEESPSITGETIHIDGGDHLCG